MSSQSMAVQQLCHIPILEDLSVWYAMCYYRYNWLVLFPHGLLLAGAHLEIRLVTDLVTIVSNPLYPVDT